MHVRDPKKYFAGPLTHQPSSHRVRSDLIYQKSAEVPGNSI